MGFRIDGTFGGVAVWISWHEGRLEASDRVPLEFAKTILSALQISPTEEIEGWYRYHKDGCFEI